MGIWLKPWFIAALFCFLRVTPAGAVCEAEKQAADSAANSALSGKMSDLIRAAMDTYQQCLATNDPCHGRSSSALLDCCMQTNVGPSCNASPSLVEADAVTSPSQGLDLVVKCESDAATASGQCAAPTTTGQTSASALSALMLAQDHCRTAASLCSTSCGTAMKSAGTDYGGRVLAASAKCSDASDNQRPDLSNRIQALTTLRDSVSKCASSASSVSDSCSSTSISASIAQGANALTNQSAGQACGQTANIAQAANAAALAVRATCQSSYSNCQSDCAVTGVSDYSDLSSQLSSAKAQCANGANLLAGLDQNIAVLRQQMAASAQCQADISNGNNTLANSTCETNPGAAGCPGAISQTASMPQGGTAPGVDGSGGSPAIGGVGLHGEGFDGSGSTLEGNQLADGSSTGLLQSSNGNTSQPLAADALAPIYGNLSASPGGNGLGANSGANKPSDPIKAAAAMKKFNTVVNAGNVRVSQSAAFASTFSRAEGSYRQDGSWIPPKVGQSNAKVDSHVFDRFKPRSLDMRMPTSQSSSAQRQEIAGPDSDIWFSLRRGYNTIALSLLPP